MMALTGDLCRSSPGSLRFWANGSHQVVATDHLIEYSIAADLVLESPRGLVGTLFNPAAPGAPLARTDNENIVTSFSIMELKKVRDGNRRFCFAV